MPAPHYTPQARQRLGNSPLADELSAIFDAIDDEPVLSALAKYRWTGRPGWSLRALWRSYLAGYYLGFGTTNELVRRLQDDLALREVCGFDGLPSRWTFGRFLSRLSQHSEAVEAVLALLTERLHELLPDFGQGIAVDGSVFRSWSNPDRPRISDPDASWTGKKSNKGKMQWWWGYKLHLAVDAKYELPVAAVVTTASAHDATQLIPVLDRARALYPWLQPRYVTADAGYDSRAISEYVVRDVRAVAVIKARNLHRKMTDSIADDQGTPHCLGGQPMTFLGYTADGKLEYRCPTGGCLLKERQGVLYCDTVVEIDPNEDLRRYSLIPRNTTEWKQLYSTRQSVERVFSRLKSHRALDTHCRRGLRKVTLHALMGLLLVQASAVHVAGGGEVNLMRVVARQLG